MKRTLYILGVISINIMLLGFIFKTNHLSGAAILIVLGFILVAFGFFPLAFINNYKKTGNTNLRTLYIAAFISIFIDLIGALFKIQHWPGANILLIIGLPLPFVLFLPVYIYYHNKNKWKVDRNFFAIIFFMVYVGVISVLLALNVSREIIEAPAVAHNNFNDIRNNLNNINQDTYNTIESNISDKNQIATISQLKAKTNSLSEFIQQTKLDIVKENNTNNIDLIVKNNEIDLLGLKWTNHTRTFSTSEGEVTKTKELQESIKEYESFIHSIQKSYPETSDEFVNSLFDQIEIKVSPPEVEEPNKVALQENSGSNSITLLSGIQSTLRLIENEILELISKNITL